jgi:hypothetical protein
VNHSYRGEAGAVSNLAPMAMLRAIAGKEITELRPTPRQHNGAMEAPPVMTPEARSASGPPGTVARPRTIGQGGSP